MLIIKDQWLIQMSISNDSNSRKSDVLAIIANRKSTELTGSIKFNMSGSIVEKKSILNEDKTFIN